MFPPPLLFLSSLLLSISFPPHSISSPLLYLSFPLPLPLLSPLLSLIPSPHSQTLTLVIPSQIRWSQSCDLSRQRQGGLAGGILSEGTFSLHFLYSPSLLLLLLCVCVCPVVWWPTFDKSQVFTDYDVVASDVSLNDVLKFQKSIHF